jgi:hypothetical protein
MIRSYRRFGISYFINLHANAAHKLASMLTTQHGLTSQNNSIFSKHHTENLIDAYRNQMLKM